MTELTKAINEYIKGFGNDIDILEIASVEWAKYSLQSYSGDLRRKALDISTAIMDFIDEHNNIAKKEAD